MRPRPAYRNPARWTRTRASARRVAAAAAPAALARRTRAANAQTPRAAAASAASAPSRPRRGRPAGTSARQSPARWLPARVGRKRCTRGHGRARVTHARG
eukprot:6087953-Prymnesium_polylepis.1